MGSLNDSDSKMEHVNLGSSGLKVSKVIYGCMQFGSSAWQPWVLDEAAALPLIKHAYDAGLNTFDTADTYSNGASERILGKALRHWGIPRRRVVIMTKCFFGLEDDEPGAANDKARTSSNSGDMVNRVGLSRKHVLDAVDASVARLGTYIDVLQVHRLDRDTPRREIMRALNDVVDAGHVRYLGASSMAAWEFQELQNVAERAGWHTFISMQGYHNLLYREEEREMIPYCRHAGIGLTPWSPVAKGALARPLTAASGDDDGGAGSSLRAQTDKTRAAWVAGFSDADAAIIARVEEVARRHGVSMACVATAWSIATGATPVVGLGSVERIDEVVRTSRFKLPESDRRYLEEPYRPKPVQGY